MNQGKRRKYMRKYMKNYYLLHPNYFYEKGKKKRFGTQKFLWKIKSVPCCDCKRKYSPWIMDFDHRNPTEKRYSLSAMKNHSLFKIKEEIAKCDIVCANCHRDRTYKSNLTRVLARPNKLHGGVQCRY
jgi:hypothetical protein